MLMVAVLDCLSLYKVNDRHWLLDNLRPVEQSCCGVFPFYGRLRSIRDLLNLDKLPTETQKRKGLLLFS